VEGSALGFNLNYKAKLRRVEVNSNFIYGTSDKKSKYEVNYSQRFLNDRRLIVNASVFKKLKPLSYPLLLGVTQFYNTFTSLMNKQDNLDYYYTSGYNLGVRYKIFPQLGLGLTYEQENQTTAYKNTNYSFRKKDIEFSPNPEINNGLQRVFGINFSIDPNSFSAIDWGDGDISRFKTTNYPSLDLGFNFAGIDIVGSTYKYRSFTAVLKGQNYLNRFLNIRYTLGGQLMNGEVLFSKLLFLIQTQGLLISAADLMQ
ncbi:MAG: DUF5686 family protein, partial [Ignavibacteria bacterium]|nr:DUF5686 family protein [Ignavibacteria bacterium]